MKIYSLLFVSVISQMIFVFVTKIISDDYSESGPQSVLRYVSIYKANTGISIRGRAPTLDNVIVEQSKGIGIVLNGGYASGDFFITNTTVSLSGSHGIWFQTSSNTILSDIHIKSCNVSNNGERGISVQ